MCKNLSCAPGGTKLGQFFHVRARCQRGALEKLVHLFFFLMQGVLKSVSSASVWFCLGKMPLTLLLLIAGSPTLSWLRPQLTSIL